LRVHVWKVPTSKQRCRNPQGRESALVHKYRSCLPTPRLGPTLCAIISCERVGSPGKA
jgi:hypothetical protein